LPLFNVPSQTAEPVRVAIIPINVDEKCEMQKNCGIRK